MSELGSTLESGDALGQIRTVLINAGITAEMIDLPSADPTPTDFPSAGADSTRTSCTSLTAPLLDADVEQSRRGKTRRSSLSRLWMKRKLHARAKMNSMDEDADREYPIEKDIYNLLWLSNNWSGPFWYSVYTICTKLALYALVLFWIFKDEKGGFRHDQNAIGNGDAPPVVQVTQVLLIPVAIGITQEIMITCSILSKMGWGEIEGHPQATRLKFHIVNFLRFADGLIWLFIIATLMNWAMDVLGMFLNFAALQFLQSVDDAAYDIAKEGYLSRELETVAGNVALVTLPSMRASWRDYIDSMILGGLLLTLIVMWALVNYVD